MSREIGTGNAHDKTQVGSEAIAGSQNSRTQGIAAGATMATLEAGKNRTSNANTTGHLNRAKKAFVRTLILWHASGPCFWLLIIVMAGAAFHRGDHRQNGVYAKALRQPDDHSHAPSRGKGG